MSLKESKKLWQYAPFGLVVLTTLILFGFNQFYLSRLTHQLATSFQTQHYRELQSGDTYGLTAKLNALSEDAQWKCIVASKDGKIFFEHHSAKYCGSAIWQRNFVITALGMPNLLVNFTIGLPLEIKIANTIVFILQLILFYSLIKISRKSELEKHRTDLHVAHIAQQVAHDIRSPLAALDVAVLASSELPEENRILIRNAVGRIRDIANNLVERSKKTERTEALSVELLPSLIDELVSEKRTQYRAHIGVEIEVQLDQSSYGIFARINTAEFKRVLSNVINNAVEALAENGHVLVRLTSANHCAILSITDNGKGIAPEILPQLMQRGATHGKENGSGLGLHHAKTTLETWGGSLALSSELAKGTTVTLTLPLAASPAWFVPRLKVVRDATVVILDDDISIHDIWEGRLKQLKLQHFSSATDLRRWCRQHESKKNLLYLFDYELAGQGSNGLDLIEELHIAQQSILVTSRYEAPEILQRCQQLGVRIIPKPMAGFVPIELLVPKLQVQLDAILIDDDTDMHFAWNLSAKTLHKTIKTYVSPREFLQDAESYPSDTPIYIDSNLQNGEKGEEISKTLYDLGFTQLYLATGYQPEKFGQLPWIKQVVGKAPPWQSS